MGTVADDLNARFAGVLRLGFARTAGDEMQAVLADPAALAPIIGELLESRAWWIGLGLGRLTRVGASAPESAGPAFKAARTAIDAAKLAAAGLAVRGEPEPLTESLQAALAALAFIVQKRTNRQREVVATVRTTESRRAAAHRLGITHQAVSDALSTAGYDPEQQLARLITALASEATRA